jgi:membrane-associated phospholipid phosphatase
MSITLVYSGEHYVADVLLGWVYAGATYVAVGRVAALRRGRRLIAGAEVRST